MELVTVALIGAVGSVATQAFKKLSKRVGGSMAQLVAFGSVLVVSLLWLVIKQYAPIEFVQLVLSAFALAVTWYEVLIKRLLK